MEKYLGTTHQIAIRDASQIGEARRSASFYVHSWTADDEFHNRVSLIVTELATNLVKNAGEGIIFLTVVDTSLQILAVDSGPGMIDVEKCLQDGYSTSGTPGTGLGAIRRKSQNFDIYSLPGRGTFVLAELSLSDLPQKLSAIGALSIPMVGEQECGDSWIHVFDDRGGSLFVVDGLGHGPLAQRASAACIGSFSQDLENPKSILERAHLAARSTRGAAASVATFYFETQKVHFAGIGNVGGALVNYEKHQRMVSHNGILGLQTRRLDTFDYDLGPQDMLVMHSDGILTNWDLHPYPGILSHHPAIISALMVREFSRGKDDVTVVVVKPWLRQDA